MNNEVLDMIMHKFSLHSLAKLSMEAFTDIYKDLEPYQKAAVNNHIMKACILLNSYQLAVPAVMATYLATPDCELDEATLYQSFILAIKATMSCSEYLEHFTKNNYPITQDGIRDYIKEGLDITEF